MVSQNQMAPQYAVPFSVAQPSIEEQLQQQASMASHPQAAMSPSLVQAAGVQSLGQDPSPFKDTQSQQQPGHLNNGGVGSDQQAVCTNVSMLPWLRHSDVGQ